MQYVSVERAIDTPWGLISRIGRHSTATRGAESFIHQSDARVHCGRERDYATIEKSSLRHRRFPGPIRSSGPPDHRHVLDLKHETRLTSRVSIHLRWHSNQPGAAFYASIPPRNLGLQTVALLLREFINLD